MFDRYTSPDYVEAMRAFLALPKRTFLEDYGFVAAVEQQKAEKRAEKGLPPKDDSKPRQGRLGSYPPEPIARIERMVNEKAALVESPDTTFGTRLQLAKDYMGLTDAELARAMGRSRELVRRWCDNKNRPRDIPSLAAYLQVPVRWLEEGGESHIPANSFLGVRVGDEMRQYREELFSKTQELLLEIPSDEEGYMQAYVEWAIHARSELSVLARRCGGRWQVSNGVLLFAPWLPIPPHGLSKKLWSDEVEELISEAFATSSSVFGAYNKLVAECEARGITEFPKRISLHKRVDKERERAERFGVDLNDVIAKSVRQYAGR